MAKDVDILTRFATANDEAVGYINRVDTATSKFRKGPRKGSIVKAAQGNLFEFPVFISNTIPLDYATATTSLLEQIYATYLQMAMSINPIIDADDSARGVQFANYKTNTNKYLEYTDTTYQHDVCHAEYINEEVKMEFDLLSIEDKEAQLINEAYDYQPLSEFDHYFQEAQVNAADMMDKLYPVPELGPYGINMGIDSNGDNYNRIVDPSNIRYDTAENIRKELESNPNVTKKQISDVMDALDNTLKFYNIPATTAYSLNKASSESDKTQMGYITTVCGSITPAEYRNNPRFNSLRTMVDDINSRNPGFRDAMFATMRNVETTRANADAIAQHNAAQERLFNQQARNFAASADKTRADMADIDGTTYSQHVLNQRKQAEAQARYTAAQADAAEYNNRTFNRALDAVTRGAQAINAGAQAVGNVVTLPDQIRAKKADAAIKSWDAAHRDEINARQWTDTYARTKTSSIQYVDDSKCAKMNTMKPLLMKVTLNRLNKNDSLQPIEYIVGVKCHTRMVQASILPEVAKYPLKEMDKISRKVKWRAGELKFFKDLVFRIKEKKQTAADSRDPNRKWYRRLYELAHMKGDAPAAAVVEGKSLFKVFIKDKQGKGNLLNGMIPNASIIMSQADVDNIKAQTEIDLLKPSAAKKFCGELFLISLIIIDTDRESIKILLPDINSDYDVHSLAAVNKQLATLDTMGSKTRDMFKLLGK